MNKNISLSDAKIKLSSPDIINNKLPSLTARNRSVSNLLNGQKRSSCLLSSPMIEKSKKNLLLMKKINPLNESFASQSDEESIMILKRLQSGKQTKILPEITLLKQNSQKKTFLKHPVMTQRLVGEDAVNKFYQRYKKLDREQEKQAFLNQKNVITNIVKLLQMHNFTPRKLTLVKMKGEQAILDLQKLGIGQGSMGPAVTQILEYLNNFEEIDLSYNCIDTIMSQQIIEKIGKVKKLNLSHNRIGKMGCHKLSEMFITTTTKIEVLNLQENNLLDSAGAILIQHLLKYNTLKILNLNKNYLGVKFSEQMKRILKGGDKQLTELYLGWNQFSSKAIKLLFEGLVEHSYLKVFDFSWNKIGQENISLLARIFQQAVNLVHADFSFCELNRKAIEVLSTALKDNHTMYGLHFEGNSGYIDYKGYLVQTNKQFHQYPLPIIKGIIRKIDGIKPNPTNQYKGSSMRDVCWICYSWQEKYFNFPYTEEMKNQVKELNSTSVQVYIHFKHEGYKAIKMICNQEENIFELTRMFPIGTVQFFFTFSPAPGKRFQMIRKDLQIVKQQINISFYIGNIHIKQKIQEMNKYIIVYTIDPINTMYEPNIDSEPRQADRDVGYRQSEKQKKKRKVIRQQKVEVEFKDLDGQQYDEFLKDKYNQDSDQNYLLLCIQFDIQNSKIPKLIKDDTLRLQFKFMMLKYYRFFKEAFYYLSKSNSNNNGIYSISELQFMGFLQEQKYVTKRVTLPKIMLKLYACLSAGQQSQISNKKLEGMANNQKKDEKNSQKLISRPQFLQFLIRLALQKWCSFKPQKKKPVEKKPFFEQQDLKFLKSKKNHSKIQKSPIKAMKKTIQRKEPLKIESKQINSPERQQINEEQEQQKQDNKQKLNLPLPLIEGIQKTMSTLYRYSQNYNSWSWRKRKYLKIDILIVLKSYDQFLNSLFFKYSSSKFKTGKPKKLLNLITLDEFKSIFLDTDIRKTKEAMKEMEQAFISAKRLPIEDGNLQFGLSYEEFQQAIARVAEVVWFNPPAALRMPLWDQQINRKNTPLFIKLQALISAIYWRTPDLHNRRLTKIVDKGIFQLEINLIMQKVADISANTGLLGISRRNSMLDGDEEISLRDIIEQLREEYAKKVIRHEEQQQYEEEVII